MTVTRITVNSLISSSGWDAEGPVTVAKLSTDDGATTAVYSPISGQNMFFTMDASSIPSGVTINSITFGASVLKLDPVDSLTRNTIKVGGNTYESGNFSPTVQNVYQYSTWTLTTNPSNGSPWTVSDLSTIQNGLKKENGAGERCSYIYADVDYTLAETGDRYLRATGNWNGAVWAYTSGGTAGSAPTPTIDEYVRITADYTVTLTADAVCAGLYQSNGGLNLGTYTLTSNASLYCVGSNARTINLGSGHLIIGNGSSNGDFSLQGSNLTFDAGTSLITVNAANDAEITQTLFNTLGNTFNDVIINIGEIGFSSSTNVEITGSPTFRLLKLESKNGSAHSVTFDQYQNVTVSKLIAIGSSTSNRLTIKNYDDSDPDDSLITFIAESTCYGDNLNMRMYGDDTLAPLYIGSGSIASGSNWLLSSPPKASTIVDGLTVASASNPNWAISGTVSQRYDGASGGGYDLVAASAKMLSTDSYDLTESEIIFERPPQSGLSDYGGLGLMGIGDIFDSSNKKVAAIFPIYDTEQHAVIHSYSDEADDYLPFEYPTVSSKYLRARISGSTITIDHSDNGSVWSTGISETLDDNELTMFKSVRIVVDNSGANFTNSQGVGSFNILPTPTSNNFLAFM